LAIRIFENMDRRGTLPSCAGFGDHAPGGRQIRIAPVKRPPDVIGTRPVDPSVGEDGVALPASSAGDTTRVRVRAPSVRPWLRAWAVELRWPLAVYGVSRLLILLLAVVETLFRRWTLWGELGNWDGKWYLEILTRGYPSHVAHKQTTLGFFPLYPLVTWLPSRVVDLSPSWHEYELAELLVALITGGCAVVLIGRLARTWWGERAERRVILFLCFFPGAVVFSMVYTEGLLLTLVAGCLLAIQQRRWLLAGVLAALSTAVGPVAVAIIPACTVAAVVELRRHGWHNGRRALLAPLMAPVGLIAFGGYLWLHTGTPFASYRAQHDAWAEKTTPLALLRAAEELFRQVTHTGGQTVINTNYIAGLVGAAILIAGLVLIVRRPKIPLPSVIWTLGVAVLTFTSAETPPNARLLLCAFPAIIVFAQRLRGRWFTGLMVLNCVLLVVMSWVTFVGVDLRP
jgi:hypothetical protein